MMRFTICFIAFLFAAANVWGQQRCAVSGYVREEGSREPMTGASVTSGKNGVISNSSGFYSIQLEPGDHELSCSFLGYDPVSFEITISADTLVNISLVQSVTELSSVVVLGNSNAVNAARFGKVNVNIGQLKYIPLFAGEQDVFKYFQLLPGVTGGKEGSSEINIRGGSSDQTLILLDEVPIYNQNHALGFVSIFNGDALGGAELYKGGIPATMGGRLSGIASMTTRNGNMEKHKQALTIGTVTASLLLEGPLKKNKISYLFSGRYFTPNLLVAAGTAIAKPETKANYMFYDLTGKLNWQLDKRNSLFLSMYTGKDAITFSLEDRHEDYNEGRSGEKKLFYRSDGGFYWNTSASSLRLNTILNKGAFLNTTLYYSGLANQLKTDYKNYIEDAYFNSGTRSKLDEIGLRSVATHNLKNHVISYGLHMTYQHIMPKEQWSETETGSNRVDNGKLTLYTGTFFVDDNITLNKWGLHLGLRVPIYYNKSKTATDIEPRLGISYILNPKSSLYLSYDRNTQPLFSLGRQYGGMPIDFWMPYRDGILQKSDQISAGWKYRPAQPLLVSFEAFYKRMTNLYFVFDEDEMLTAHSGFDRGEGRSFGGEMMVQYTGRTNTLMLSYAQISSKRIVDGERFDFMYDIPFNLNLYGKQQTLQRHDRTHFFSFNMNWHSGLPYVLSNEVFPTIEFDGRRPVIVPNNPKYPNIRLVNYFRLDLNYSMERQMRNGKRVWQFSILNATNYFNPYMVVIKDNKFKGISIMPIMPSFSYRRFW